MVGFLNPALPSTNVTSNLSDADDTVIIRKAGDDEYAVTINGDTEVVSAEVLKKMKFDLQGGNDVLVVDENVDVAITADGGDGNDYMVGGRGADVFSGGRGNDYLNGRSGKDAVMGGDGNDTLIDLLGNDIMVGNGGSDRFITGTKVGTLADVTREDQHQTIGGPANNPPTTSGPQPNNPPVTSGPTTPGAPTTGSGNYTLANHMAGPGGVGFTLTAEGTYTSKGKEFTTTMTQPGGPGTPFRTTLNYTSGPHSGTTVVYNAGPDGTSKFLAFHNPNFTPEQNAMVTKGLQNGDYLAKMLDLAMGGDSKMKKKGAHGNTSASGASGSATGSAEADTAVDGSSDGYSGLNVDGANEATSWFLVLAEGMGKIMNKFAEKMIDLLNQIEAAGDDPPYELTAKFQATSQQLAFMQQAFMTALNSLGESIKTGVTAGGAAR